MALTPEQAAALGLDDEPSPRRVLSSDEAQSLGLEGPSDAELAGGPVVGRVRSALKGTVNAFGGDPAKILALMDGPEGEAQDRKVYDAAARAYPGFNIGGEIAPSLAAPAKVIPQAVLGATAGYGTSKSDSLGGKLSDAAIGAGLQGGFTKLGGKFANWLRGGSEKAAEKVAGAEAKALQLATDKVDEGIASASGKLGGETQKGNRFLENLERYRSAMGPEDTAAFDELVNSGVVPKLREKLVSSNLKSLPQQATVIDDLAAQLDELKVNRVANIGDETQNVLSKKEALNQVAERAKRYLPPAAGDWAAHISGAPGRAVVGGAIGYALGGGDGMNAGLGALAGAGLRPAIQSMRRLAQHPAVQKPVWEGLGAASRGAGAAVERLAPAAGAELATEVPEWQRRLAEYLRASE